MPVCYTRTMAQTKAKKVIKYTTVALPLKIDLEIKKRSQALDISKDPLLALCMIAMELLDMGALPDPKNLTSLRGWGNLPKWNNRDGVFFK